MPYGLPKKLDTPENNAKMERCVKEQTKDGMEENLAIRICKASIMGTTNRKKNKS